MNVTKLKVAISALAQSWSRDAHGNGHFVEEGNFLLGVVDNLARYLCGTAKGDKVVLLNISARAILDACCASKKKCKKMNHDEFIVQTVLNVMKALSMNGLLDHLTDVNVDLIELSDVKNTLWISLMCANMKKLVRLVFIASLATWNRSKSFAYCIQALRSPALENFSILFFRLSIVDVRENAPFTLQDVVTTASAIKISKHLKSFKTNGVPIADQHVINKVLLQLSQKPGS